MSVLRNSRGHAAFPLILIGALMAPIAAFAASDTESVAVVVDQARVIKLPERVATIVVGNPLIADVTLQPGGMAVVTGKGYGSTNMIALDRTGAVLADRSIQTGILSSAPMSSAAAWARPDPPRSIRKPGGPTG